MSSSVEQQSKVSFTIRRPNPSSSRAASTGPGSDAVATPPHATSAPSFKIPALPRHLTEEGAGSRSGSNSPKSRARTYEDRGEESDSSEEERTEDELVTGFDQFGVQRCVSLSFTSSRSIPTRLSTSTTIKHAPPASSSLSSPFKPRVRFALPEPVPQLTKALTPVTSPHPTSSSPLIPIHEFTSTPSIHSANGERKKPAAPLVIPSLASKDWRALARQRRGIKQPTYIPPSAAATTGADGSQGGLGTKDTINSGPELRGLQVRKKVKLEKTEEDGEGDVKMEEETSTVEVKAEEDIKVEPETEDQRAIRLLLSGQDASSEPTIDIIPPPVSETEAFQQDIQILPESATLADYERVPVSQFGAALLRGMGWTPDGPAGKGKHLKGKKAIEPYLPSARPALLGIGAKEREVLDDGDLRKKKMGRPEKRYVPVIKREGSEGRTSRGESRSRRESPERDGRRSGSERLGDRDRDRERSYDDRDRERRKEKGKERDYGDRRRDDRDRDYRRRKDDDKERRDVDADRDRDRRSSRRDDDCEDRPHRRDRDRDESRSSRRRD